MSLCTIFGGAGFIGTHLAQFLLERGLASHVHIADVRASPLQGSRGISVSATDVRRPIPLDITECPPSWIFNLAAVHREPGHANHEYFETNIAGASNVCEYAERTGAGNIFFTSSISVYGYTRCPTAEDAPACATSAYGASKYPAEWIHRTWLAGHPHRRLVICRPGVIYGPGDPGNILRMIRAIQGGYFVFPGLSSIYKSYGYIFGLLDSIVFTMLREERLTIYNYVESPTESLNELVEHTQRFLGKSVPVISVPLPLLLPLAKGLQLLMGDSSPIHPVRVRKAAMSTHILPLWLQEHGFEFRYPFMESLRHWASVRPADFMR